MRNYVVALSRRQICVGECLKRIPDGPLACMAIEVVCVRLHFCEEWLLLGIFKEHGDEVKHSCVKVLVPGWLPKHVKQR